VAAFSLFRTQNLFPLTPWRERHYVVHANSASTKSALFAAAATAGARSLVPASQNGAPLDGCMKKLFFLRARLSFSLFLLKIRRERKGCLTNAARRNQPATPESELCCVKNEPISRCQISEKGARPRSSANWPSLLIWLPLEFDFAV